MFLSILGNLFGSRGVNNVIFEEGTFDNGTSWSTFYHDAWDLKNFICMSGYNLRLYKESGNLYFDEANEGNCVSTSG